MTAIGDLTREHDLVVDVIGAARSAHLDGDVARMVQAARQIEALLEPHTRVEEDGLFPALAGEFPEQIESLEAEHRLIEPVLREAAHGVPAAPDWPQRLMAVLDVLRHHILKEQDGVFPAALASLSTEEWERIDAVRARVGTALPGVHTSAG
ncbi:hemerythrin domain-containing protein [Actinocrinis puniceicyclus]|uniref:Hemerythrin domain-containing protein n=1 Tax=Actinocrinis puniceicyclus TaxID=977794 RepID=A0A8J8BCH8_9ACTN|nr:hemerythrin domain-containing protein [Actinocrinis puniceicyclus]MBS2964178.1 hemerythrin domain-containing protein [Actinocrinis puniceicyclus]